MSRNKDPKYQAWYTLNNAIRDGKIVPKLYCQSCGDVPEGKLEAHHSNYHEPLDVIWLCKQCHIEADKARRKAEKQADYLPKQKALPPSQQNPIATEEAGKPAAMTIVFGEE